MQQIADRAADVERVAAIDLALRGASRLASIAVAWSLVEVTLTFLVGSNADSAMFIALAHAATIDILTGMIGKAQVSALASSERFAFNDRKSEALAFVVTGIASVIGAGSAAFRTFAHFHGTPATVSHIQQAEEVLVAASSAVVLYLIARGKHQVAAVTGNDALYTDADGEYYSAYMAMSVLLTTVFVWFVPWTPLDPIVALLIAVLLAWQGVYGVRTGIHIHRRAFRQPNLGTRVSPYAPK